MMNSDKERILSIIANFIERSRTNPQPQRRLTRNLLLEQMNQRRPAYAQMSRDEFQNYFTTRPDRRTVIPSEDLVCLIEVILEVSPGSASAQEILELCDAGRLPIREFRRLARFFPLVEWNNAWKLYDAAKISAGNYEVDFNNRLVLVSDINQSFDQHTIVCISGPSGIGKTHVALKICASVESLNTRRVVVLSGHQIVDIESFVAQMCLVLHVAPIGNESLLLRLQSIVRTTPLFVFIDDLVGKTNDEMIGLLRHIVNLITHIQLLVTTILPLTSISGSGLRSVVVHPLTMDESLVLFKQTCQQNAIFPRNSAMLQGKIRQCDGNPLAIKLLAFSFNQSRNMVMDYDMHIYRVLEVLSELEQRVIETLVLFESFVSVQFVKKFVFDRGASDGDVFNVIHALVRKGLVTVYEYNLISLHAVARIWYQQRWDYTQWALKRITFIHALDGVYESFIQQDDSPYIDRHDWHNVVEVMRHVIKDAGVNLDIVVNGLFRWHVVWTDLRLHQSILLLCEQIKGTEFTAEVDARFQLVYGSGLWRCGFITEAREVLTSLEVTCMLSNNLLFVGMSKIELALTYMTEGNSHFAYTYINQAIIVFTALKNESFIASAYSHLVQIQMHRGQHADVLTTCMKIEQTSLPVNCLINARVAYLRAQISIVTHKYGLAHQQLNDAYAKFQFISIETYMWDVSIMHALCSVLEGRLQDAHMQLQQILKKIEYFDHQQLVHVAECGALYLMKIEQEIAAGPLIQLLAVCIPLQSHVYMLFARQIYQQHMAMIQRVHGEIGADCADHEEIWQLLMVYIKQLFQSHASFVS